jgi:hypothetical protein
MNDKLYNLIQSQKQKEGDSFIVSNEDFELKYEADSSDFIFRWVLVKSPKYKGKDIFKAIIDIAKKEGYKEINALAAKGKTNNVTANGYYSLVKWGFIPTKDITWVNKLLNTSYNSYDEAFNDPNFLPLWKEKGKETYAIFDLDPNSTSFKQFNKTNLTMENKLNKLIKETLKKHYSPKSCDCGCGGCDSKDTSLNPIILHESLNSSQQISENLQYHIKKQKPLSENIFRYGSTAFLNLWSESRKLLKENKIQITNVIDLEILTETDLGEYGMYEGQKVPLDLPMLNEAEYDFNINKIWDFIESRPFNNPNYMPKFSIAKEIWDEWGDEEKQLYNNFQWEDKYNGQLHHKEIANLQRRKNYDSLAGINEAEFKNKNINENVDYEKLANLILNVDSNQPIYYNSSWNVVNIGGTGYDKGDLIKHFKSQPGQSMDIKNIFYHADKDPIKTKNEIERITNGRITVDTSKGMVRYLKNSLTEAEFKGKKVQLNKPKRGGAGGKKFYVYVKDGDKVKKVSFGDSGGLSTKVNDPKARQAFAKRHDCKNKKDRTKAGYWSCNIGKYWKALGGSKNFSGYW